jgi:hypothetical protein
MAQNGFASGDKRLIMKRIMFLLGCSMFAVNSFSQNVAELNNKLTVTSVAAASVTDVRINPNPVTEETFTIELQNLEKGKYSIYLYDEKGRKYLIKVLNLEESMFTGSLQLPKKATKGIYILQVISKTARFSRKMIVE